MMQNLFDTLWQQCKNFIAEETPRRLPQLFDWLRQNLQQIQEEVVPLMTYESAIEYFVTERPKNPKVKKGAILRQPHPQGYYFVQVFLDSNDQIVHRPDEKPYGRLLVVNQLDDELLDTFGDQNLIIVE